MRLLDPSKDVYKRQDVHYIYTDKTEKNNIYLSAKYTYYSYTATHAVKLKGGYFEASNQKDFKKADSLTAINGICLLYTSFFPITSNFNIRRFIFS